MSQARGLPRKPRGTCCRCMKNIGMADGDVHTCSPTPLIRNLETRIADLELDRDAYMGQHERDQTKIKELEDKCWQYANVLYMIGTENCQKPFELARNTRDMFGS